MTDLQITMEEDEAFNALEKQVAGNHYKDLPIQPVEYIHANALGYFEGNVIKYVSRWRNKNGVADRVVCLPDGSTWFIEVKTEGGRLSPLQKVFADEMARLKQNYACLWSKEDIDEWLINASA